MTAHRTAPVDQALKAIDTARALTDHLDRVGKRPVRHLDHTLFERNLTVVMTGEDALSALPVIAAAAEAGHSCRLELEADGNLDIVWRADATPDVEGDSDFLLDPGERNILRRLIAAGDIVGVIQTLLDRSFVLRTSLRSREVGLAWIPSHELLIDSLGSGAWLSTLLQMSRWSVEGHAIFFVDGLDHPVHTRAFTFLPIDQVSSPPPGPTASEPVKEGGLFRDVRVERGWPQVPAPPAVSPDPGSGGVLASALVSAAHCLAWMWLSSEPPTITASSVVAHYRGVRDVEVTLTPQPGIDRKELDQAVALWRWTSASGDDPVRTDATQRGITLAVAGPADLVGAAGPALRNACTLHDLAISGAIAEALAARRAGRTAAAAAANTAATTSRETAGKATERSLALMVAVAAVVFATEILSRPVDRRVMRLVDHLLIPRRLVR